MEVKYNTNGGIRMKKQTNKYEGRPVDELITLLSDQETSMQTEFKEFRKLYEKIQDEFAAWDRKSVPDTKKITNLTEKATPIFQKYQEKAEERRKILDQLIRTTGVKEEEIGKFVEFHKYYKKLQQANAFFNQ